MHVNKIIIIEKPISMKRELWEHIFYDFMFKWIISFELNFITELITK